MIVDPKNRLNDLDSKRWLQFQKSWFPATGRTVEEFVSFFTKQKKENGLAGSIGILPEQAEKLAPDIRFCGREPVLIDSPHAAGTVDYVLIDWRDHKESLAGYNENGPARLEKIAIALSSLLTGGYLTILMRNGNADAKLAPIAWHFAGQVSRLVAPKDEKIGCEPSTSPASDGPWQTEQNCFYCLNFRKQAEAPLPTARFTPLEIPHPGSALHEEHVARRSAWSVVKPPPREKGVLLHPAKFPESLAVQFINDFSHPGEIVFDPMAGTGSALIAARRTGRRSAGIELNPEFVEIVRRRSQQDELFSPAREGMLVCGDATQMEAYATLPPVVDYVVTSPPYWDMLRMKGAETQKKRRDAGMPVFYSEHPNDLGNLPDYGAFLEMLLRAYRLTIERLKPGGFMTVIVKNVKKRGAFHPLAWDIAFALSPLLELRHEQFWCQDDQKLAPFGYRYAWVSNTFHHYCLHFRKPPV